MKITKKDLRKLIKEELMNEEEKIVKLDLLTNEIKHLKNKIEKVQSIKADLVNFSRNWNKGSLEIHVINPQRWGYMVTITTDSRFKDKLDNETRRLPNYLKKFDSEYNEDDNDPLNDFYVVEYRIEL